jgi:uncharacterized protein (DUF4415 family)
MADPEFSLDPNDYEDGEIDDPQNPEWTDEDFARARPLREALPELYAQIVAEREVGLKLPADTIRAFAEEGEDWKERMVETLTEAARKKHAA